MAQFYPGGALRMGQRGKVVMDCAVTAVGTLQTCQVISETPGGLGFADAALHLASFFKLRTDGASFDGAIVRIPIVFSNAQLNPPGNNAGSAANSNPY